MARYTQAVCRICRREGEKLNLKGRRCVGPKCAIERRPYPPGATRQRRVKLSDYGVQLREKQKVRKSYGMLEKQFRIFFQRSAKQKGVTSLNLLRMLEMRMDNMVYRLGFAASKAQARQMVRHGHFLVNGKKVDIPSYQMKVDQVLEAKSSEKTRKLVKENIEMSKGREVPEWINLDQQGLKGSIVKIPEREEIGVRFNEGLIIELYSK